MYRFFYFVILSNAYAQIQLSGSCNFTNLEYVKTVNETFLGDWHQIARINNNFEHGQCSKSTYSAQTATELYVVNSEVVNKTVHFRNGTIIVRSNGLLNMTFSDGSYDSVILKTDNLNYALLYSCRDGVNDTKSVWAWKFSRTTALTDQQIKDINAAVSANADLQNATWLTVDHSKNICNSCAALRVTPFLMLYALYVMCKEYF